MRQKVIIVGATSGIGRRLAELYLEKGNRVGITGRRLELLEEISKQYPQQLETECFDVASTEAIVHIESLVKKLGGLDILIMSAGIGEVSKELDWNIEKLTIDTNINGFIRIVHWGFNYFTRQGHGHLAAISSVAANRGNSWAPAYSASKAFQSNYMESLSIKALKMKTGIHITCIEPGFVNTKMAKSDKLFWVVPVEKAAKQIIRALEKKKRKVYVSKRWRLVAGVMRHLPYYFFKRLG